MDNLSFNRDEKRGEEGSDSSDETKLEESSQKAIEFFVGFVYAAIISVFLQSAFTSEVFDSYRPFSLPLPTPIKTLFGHLWESNLLIIISLFFIAFLAQDWAARVKVRYQVIKGPIPYFALKILLEIFAVFSLFIGFSLILKGISISNNSMLISEEKMINAYLMFAAFAVTSQIWNWIILLARTKVLRPENARYCSECKEEILESDEYCISCGVRLESKEKKLENLGIFSKIFKCLISFKPKEPKYCPKDKNLLNGDKRCRSCRTSLKDRELKLNLKYLFLTGHIDPRALSMHFPDISKFIKNYEKKINEDRTKIGEKIRAKKDIEALINLIVLFLRARIYMPFAVGSLSLTLDFILMHCILLNAMVGIFILLRYCQFGILDYSTSLFLLVILMCFFSIISFARSGKEEKHNKFVVIGHSLLVLPIFFILYPMLNLTWLTIFLFSQQIVANFFIRTFLSLPEQEGRTERIQKRKKPNSSNGGATITG